jgi:hypothetical protein
MEFNWNHQKNKNTMSPQKKKKSLSLLSVISYGWNQRTQHNDIKWPCPRMFRK